MTFVVLPELFKEPGIAELANYFDDCRTKRNVAGYDSIGGISIEEVQELRKEAREFRGRVLGW